MSAPVILGIMHSAPLCDCLQVCHVACREAESPMLACMAVLSLAALLLLAQFHKPATQEKLSENCNCSLTAFVKALALQCPVKCTAMHCCY